MKKSSRAVFAVYMVALIILVNGCTYNLQITTKDTASWMNSIYNAQYNDYLSWFVKDANGNLVVKPDTPDTQKVVLNRKKAIFTKLHPLLITYSEYARTGIVPTGVIITDVEAQAIGYVNDLIAEGGK